MADYTSGLYVNYRYEKFKVGDWVSFDKTGYSYTGFIVELSFTYAKVFLVKVDNPLAKKHCGKNHSIEYEKIEPMSQAELSIEQIKDAIDIALDWKDKELFDSLIADLFALQDQLEVLT